MCAPKVALFGPSQSAQLALLRDSVRELGGVPLTLDIQLGGPSAPGILIGAETLVWNGNDLHDIDVVHVCCTARNTPIAVPPVMNASNYSELRACYLREQEYQAATFSFFAQLKERGKLVINSPAHAYLDHDAKAHFYEKLRKLGFPVPRTLTTNDPERANAFFAEVGEVVAKPAIGIAATRLITSEDLKRVAEIRTCPVLFQERMRGDILRAHVVGDRLVLALKVVNRGEIDSRTAPLALECYALTEVDAQRLVAATQALELQFAAWDLIVNPEGRIYYLDCNPGPYLLWVGAEYSRFILRQLAAFMLAYARHRCLAEASRQIMSWPPP